MLQVHRASTCTGCDLDRGVDVAFGDGDPGPGLRVEQIDLRVAEGLGGQFRQRRPGLTDASELRHGGRRQRSRCGAQSREVPPLQTLTRRLRAHRGPPGPSAVQVHHRQRVGPHADAVGTFGGGQRQLCLGERLGPVELGGEGERQELRQAQQVLRVREHLRVGDRDRQPHRDRLVGGRELAAHDADQRTDHLVVQEARRVRRLAGADGGIGERAGHQVVDRSPGHHPPLGDVGGQEPDPHVVLEQSEHGLRSDECVARSLRTHRQVHAESLCRQRTSFVVVGRGRRRIERTFGALQLTQRRAGTTQDEVPPEAFAGVDRPLRQADGELVVEQTEGAPRRVDEHVGVDRPVRVDQQARRAEHLIGVALRRQQRRRSQAPGVEPQRRQTFSYDVVVDRMRQTDAAAVRRDQPEPFERQQRVGRALDRVQLRHRERLGDREQLEDLTLDGVEPFEPPRHQIDEPRAGHGSTQQESVRARLEAVHRQGAGDELAQDQRVAAAGVVQPGDRLVVERLTERGDQRRGRVGPVDRTDRHRGRNALVEQVVEDVGQRLAVAGGQQRAQRVVAQHLVQHRCRHRVESRRVVDHQEQRRRPVIERPEQRRHQGRVLSAVLGTHAQRLEQRDQRHERRAGGTRRRPHHDGVVAGRRRRSQRDGGLADARRSDQHRDAPWSPQLGRQRGQFGDAAGEGPTCRARVGPRGVCTLAPCHSLTVSRI